MNKNKTTKNVGLPKTPPGRDRFSPLGKGTTRNHSKIGKITPKN